MKTIKSMAELYALGQITFQQLEEACGGKVTESVINYVRAYEAEYNLHLQVSKLRSELRQMRDAYKAASEHRRKLGEELEANVSHYVEAIGKDETGKPFTFKVGMSFIIPAGPLKERINK